MENDYFLLVDSVLQVGDVGRFVFVLEYLASENLLSHIVVHCARFGVEAYVGRAVEFYDFIWVRGDVDGHYLVVVEGLDTKVREGVDAEMVLGFVLYISLICVDRLHMKVAHVVAETCDIALVVDAEIERMTRLASMGGFIPCPDHRLMPGSKFELVQYYAEKIKGIKL